MSFCSTKLFAEPRAEGAPLESRPYPQTTNSRRGATTQKWVFLRESTVFV